MTARDTLREHAETDVEPDRSSTCAICGELADERRTQSLDPQQTYEAGPESFELIGRVFVARALFGSGEAHQYCIEHFNEQPAKDR